MVAAAGIGQVVLVVDLREDRALVVASVRGASASGLLGRVQNFTQTLLHALVRHLLVVLHELARH